MTKVGHVRADCKKKKRDERGAQEHDATERFEQNEHPKGGAQKGGAPMGGAPMGGGPKPRKSGVPKGGVPKGGGPKGGGPKFCVFFCSLPPEISFFLLSLGGLLVEFWWCFDLQVP